MKKDIAEKWVEALRSGEYEQGKNSLNRDNKFCCLGVLCDISKLGKWIGPKTVGDKYYKVGQSSDANYLPREIQEWSDITGNKGEVEKDNLSYLNDRGKTFEEIANIIELNWEQL